MSSSYPPWLLPSLAFNIATALTFRSRLIDAAAIVYGLYWLFYFILYPPAGPFVELLVVGQFVFRFASVTISFLLIKDREKDFVRDEVGRRAHEQPRVHGEEKRAPRGPRMKERSVWRRWLDGLEVSCALRGAGWAFQVSGIPAAKPPTYPRWKFVLENLVGAAWRFLAIDIGSTYIRSTSVGSLPIAKLLREEPLYRGLLHAALIQMIARWGMDLTYRLIAAMAVVVEWGGPADWPPMFGSWVDAWTVRQFWSKTWHQMMRTIAEPPVYWLLHDLLGIRKGTYLSNYGKVFGAFFVAYAMHGYGSKMAGGSHVGDWNYFMSQAVVIWVEETVLRLATALGIRQVLGDRLARFIGYVWTGAFSLYSFMLWNDWAAAAGALTVNPFGFSITGSLLESLSSGRA